MSDLILFNANVITMNPVFPWAQLVAMEDDKILYVGRNNRLDELKHKKTKLIDCHGKAVLPGFIDAHCHLHALAESYITLNLEPCNNVRSVSDIQAKIRDLSQPLPPGTWIRGRGYNEFYLAEKRHPNRLDLDAITSAHPIKLTHRTGHAHVLNSLALNLVGISKETPDPPDGLIDRDIETGEPTGLLYRMGDYLSKKVPMLEKKQLDYGMEMANKELLSLGITSVQDASSHNGIEQWRQFNRWKDKGLLRVRVSMMFGIEAFKAYREKDFQTHLDENQLRLGGVKIILDETIGHLRPDQAELNERVLNIHLSGFQAVLHAVDATPLIAACSAIEYALQTFPKPDHRHRIEHCSVCTQPFAKRLASLGIMVVTQPSFIYYNGERYLKTVPDSNLKHLYPISTLMENGVKVAGSSDFPVASPNPLIGIYSAVSQRAESGEYVLPEERISPLEALKLYTEYAAKATFEEMTKGSIVPGKMADLIVLNDDPTKTPVDEIKDIKVEMTILNGEVVWDKMS